MVGRRLEGRPFLHPADLDRRITATDHILSFSRPREEAEEPEAALVG